MSESRPHAEQEEVGYPVSNWTKQREGLKDFLEELNPLDELQCLPTKSENRIFTMATDKTPRNSEEEKAFIEEEKKVKVTDSRAMEEPDVTELVDSCEDLIEFYSVDKSLPSLFNEPTIVKAYVDSGELKLQADRVVEQGVLAYLNETVKSFEPIASDKETPDARKERMDVLKTAATNFEVFVASDHQAISQLIQRNTISTSGSIGVYDYKEQAIITANSAIFLKLRTRKIKGKDGEIEIIDAYGSDKGMYALLPEQLRQETSGTFLIRANTTVYRDYPSIIIKEYKDKRETVRSHKWLDTEAYVLPVTLEVKKVSRGTNDYSPKLEEDGVPFIKVEILGQRPHNVKQTVVAVEKSFLEPVTQTKASLTLKSEEILFSREPGISRDFDQSSDTEISTSPIGNDKPFFHEISHGLAPFKGPAFQDPGIAMSESPDAEYKEKETEYIELSNKVKNLNLKLYSYLISKTKTK